MVKWHVNKKGEVKECRATIFCRFKDYSTRYEATVAQKMQARQKGLEESKKSLLSTLENNLSDPTLLVHKTVDYDPSNRHLNSSSSIRRSVFARKEYELKNGAKPASQTVSFTLKPVSYKDDKNVYLNVKTKPYFSEELGSVCNEWVVTVANQSQSKTMYQDSYSFKFDENYDEEMKRFGELGAQLVDSYYRNSSAVTQKTKDSNLETLKNSMSDMFYHVVSDEIGAGRFVERYLGENPVKENSTFADLENIDDFNLSIDVEYNSSSFSADSFKSLMTDYTHYRINMPDIHLSVADNSSPASRWVLEYDLKEDSDVSGNSKPIWSIKLGEQYHSFSDSEEVARLVDQYFSAGYMSQSLKTEKINYIYNMVKTVNSIVEEETGKKPIGSDSISKKTAYTKPVRAEDMTIENLTFDDLLEGNSSTSLYSF